MEQAHLLIIIGTFFFVASLFYFITIVTRVQIIFILLLLFTILEQGREVIGIGLLLFGVVAVLFQKDHPVQLEREKVRAEKRIAEIAEKQKEKEKMKDSIERWTI